MKRTNNLLGICLLASVMTACTEGNPLHDSDGRPTAESVPIILQAGSQTKAVVNQGEAFTPLLVCSDFSKKYTKLRWQNNASVDTEGHVVYDGYDADKGPTYPVEDVFPFDIYVCGVHPQGADLQAVPNGATYSVDGTQDIMYAPEVFGNYQEGQRICGNQDASKDQPLVFTHLFTQLQFNAYCAGEIKNFKITRITLKEVPQSVTVSLADGSLTVSPATDALNTPVYDVSVTAGDAQNPTAVGYALVPAAASYVAEVQTSLGLFSDVQIQPSNGTPLVAGRAHAIMLRLTDSGIVVQQVTTASWAHIEGGDIKL